MRSTEEVRLHSARNGLISPPDVQRRQNDPSLRPPSRRRGCDVRDFAILRILRSRFSLSRCCKYRCVGSAKPGGRSLAPRLRRFAHPPRVAGARRATTVTIGEFDPRRGTSANLGFARNATSNGQRIWYASQLRNGLAVDRALGRDSSASADASDISRSASKRQYKATEQSRSLALALEVRCK
jgi:hypothetical protein